MQKLTKNLGILFVGLGCCLPSTFAFAQTAPSGVGSEFDAPPAREDTYETPRGVAMGLGGRAAVLSTSALAYNPANLGMARLYHLDATAAVISGDGAWSIGSAVVDSASNKLAVGAGFRGILSGDTRQYKGWDWRAAAGLSLLDQLSVGVGFRFAKIRGERNASGELLGPRLHAFTMDAAIRATPARWLHIAALGYNLIKTDSPLAPQQLGGSVALMPVDGLQLVTDILVDLTTFDEAELLAGAGVEYLVKGQIPIRLGFRRDAGRDINQITAGIGYYHQVVSLDIGLRQDLGDEPRESAIVFAVRYHVK